jgi:peroxiredoxin Q/BCP
MTTATVAPGQQVPDLTLSDQDGAPVRLRDLAGKHVVLYFYPKDDTPGCTVQACDLRDNWGVFAARDDVEVFGVSPDSPESHQRFREKHELPFRLLVDDGHELADTFEIWREKKNYGKTYWGVERSTVLIDPDGTVRTIKRRVKPADHVSWLREELGL